jgi:N,N-dimethylformamidase
VKSILGYSDRFSVAPDQKIAFKISSEKNLPFALQIVRLIHGDTNPSGPGYKDVAVPAVVNGTYPGRRQIITSGSYAVVSASPLLSGLRDFSFQTFICPTTPHKARQAIASLWDDSRQVGFYLSLDGANGLTAVISDGEAETVALHKPIRAGQWYAVAMSFEASTGILRLAQRPLLENPRNNDKGQRQLSLRARGIGAPDAEFVFAARGGTIKSHFYNGKIDSPLLAGVALDEDALACTIHDHIIAAWDFSQDISGISIIDTGTNALHGRIIQLPARGVAGHNWDGSAFCWQDIPEQYGAIHFHDDDIYDAGWQDDAIWHVPHDIKSGLYAARITVAGDEDYIPFVITPSPHKTAAPILLIIPSASYMAYANEHLAFDADLAERVHDLVPVFPPADIFLSAHREYGGSLYDRHSDNSGSYYSSRLRPILNMRPKYQSWLGGTGSALWQLNADTHITDWLEANGFDYDCITDEDLHESGGEILQRYRCVVTGTHPEYISTTMQDHLAAFQNQGGRLVYLGGNGFYWRIAYHASLPGVIEVRRCEVGNGWITPPGEAFHSFNGEYGGLWRRLGRAPQAVTGVGFVGQGFDISSYYRRLPESEDPRVEFIFDGVEQGALIGDFGLIGGGAAGLELDCADASLGTPAHALVLARSENHTSNYLPTVETLLINYAGQSAEFSNTIHADMVFFETASGGAVFSTGSIAWAGSLSYNNYQNNVSAITANVIRRFTSPQRF